MNDDQETTAMIHALAKQFGQWLAAALHRVPTKAETDILLQELAKMPHPCSTADVAAATSRAAKRLGVVDPATTGAL